ncbi:hypothetical protein ES705_31790 [subsurface metagenome]
MNNAKGTTYDSDDWQIRYNWNNEDWTGSAGVSESTFPNSERAQSTVEGNPNLVRYEWKLNWTELAAGGNFIAIQTAKFGFDCAIGDVPMGATSRTKILTWNYETDVAYQNPSVFGEIILLDEPAANKQTELEKVQVMPNPANDILYITNAHHANRIVIYNVLGTEVSRVQHPESSMTIVDVSHLKTGLYYVAVSSANGSLRTIKVYIQ